MTSLSLRGKRKHQRDQAWDGERMTDSEHPRQQLSFFAIGDWTPAAEGRVRTALDRLASSRRWTLGPPEVAWGPGEMSGAVALHSAYPPWDQSLSLRTDEAELAQTRALVEVLVRASVELATKVAIEMDGEQVGEIIDGVADAGITEALIAEWERVSEERRRKADRS